MSTDEPSGSMNSSSSNLGANIEILKRKALKTISETFFPTLELRIIGFVLVFLCLLIKPLLGDEDYIFSLGASILAILCIIVSTWLELFLNYSNHLKFRHNVSSGLSYGILLPPIIIASLLCTASYGALTMEFKAYICSLQFYLLATTLCGFITIISTVLYRVAKPPNNITLMFLSIIIVTVLAYNIFPIEEGFISMMLLLSLCLIIYIILIDTMPYTFSPGEALVISQFISLLLFDTAYLILNKYKIISLPSFFRYNKRPVTICIQFFLSYTISYSILSLPAWFFIKNKKNTKLWIATIVITLPLFWFILGMPLLSGFLKMNPITWFLTKFLFANKLRIRVILYMGLVTFVSIIVGYLLINLTSVHSIYIRKVFHIFGIIIYLPSIYADIDSVSLGSSVALVLLILVEFLHNLQIGPFSSHIQNYMRILSGRNDNTKTVSTESSSTNTNTNTNTNNNNNNDNNFNKNNSNDNSNNKPTLIKYEGLYLNHIYLVLGFSLPIWIQSNPWPPHLEVQAGICALGVIDSMSAFIGKRFGKRKWFKNEKTVEGFLSGMVSGILFLLLLSYVDRYNSLASISAINYRLVRFISSVVLTSILEAITSQHDNLMLSPFLYSILSIVNSQPLNNWF